MNTKWGDDTLSSYSRNFFEWHRRHAGIDRYSKRVDPKVVSAFLHLVPHRSTNARGAEFTSSSGLLDDRNTEDEDEESEKMAMDKNMITPRIQR